MITQEKIKISNIARRERLRDLQATRKAFAKGDKEPIPVRHIHEYYMSQMRDAWSKNFRFDKNNMTLFSTDF